MEGQNEGDLRVAIKRSASAAWGKKYDWSFELTPVDGGILEEADRNSSMFLAPKEGYAKSYQMAFAPSDEEWSYAIGKRFYLMSRGGKVCGRLDVEVQAFYLKDNLGRVNIKYAANPSGSLVLR